MKILAALLVCLVAGASQAASIHAPAPLITGYYSNLVGSDDIEGLELKISRGHGVFRATLSYAEGGCGAAVSSVLIADQNRWRFDGVMRDGATDNPVHIWLLAERGGLRVIPGPSTDWIAQSPRGDLLYRVRKPICLK